METSDSGGKHPSIATVTRTTIQLEHGRVSGHWNDRARAQPNANRVTCGRYHLLIRCHHLNGLD